MQPAEAAQTGQRPRFPALDPEPPRRRWRRAALALTVVTVAVAGVLGYAALRPGPGGSTTGRHAQGSPFSGLVLAQTPSGVLSLTDVHTGRVVRLAKLGQFAASPPPAVSPDGKFLVDVAMGRLFSLDNPTRPVGVPNALSYPTYINLFLPEPFSDHDASLLIQSYPAYFIQTSAANSDYSVQSVRTGRTAQLGIADSAAADPQDPGAFVAYARPSRVTPPGGVQPDIRLELRDAGARPRVLATSARISHVLGIKPRYGVTLVPYPNPQGTMVAVTVQPIGAGGLGEGGLGEGGLGGIVVYSRAGKMLGFQTVGPPGARGLAWSQSGTTLAFAGQGANGAEFTEWEVGGGSTTSEMAASLRQIGECSWSPDDLSVLCGGGPAGAWLILQSGTTYAFAGHGQVLAWLSGRLAG